MTKALVPSLSSRQRLIAFYIACGRSGKEIAKELGVTPQTISIAKKSPLFHVFVTQIQRDIIDKGAKQAAEQVLADGAANVRFLRRLRDGDQDLLSECGEKMMRLRLGASTVLFDRQMPRVREASAAAPQIVINVDGIQRALADGSCREVGEPIEIDTQNAGWHLRQLDDVVAEHERDAQDG